MRKRIVFLNMTLLLMAGLVRAAKPSVKIDTDFVKMDDTHYVNGTKNAGDLTAIPKDEPKGRHELIQSRTYDWSVSPSENAVLTSSSADNKRRLLLQPNAFGNSYAVTVVVTWDVLNTQDNTHSYPAATNTITIAVINIAVSFNPTPVDNIIKGLRPVPVRVMFTPSTFACSLSFQVNNNNVTVQGTAPNITVTGVAVGESTVKAMWNGIEVGRFTASVIENPDFLPASGTVADGAPPSHNLSEINAKGMAYPEFVTSNITAGRDGSTWRAIMTSATARYSLQATLGKYAQEVDPNSNTTEYNWIRQVEDLGNHKGSQVWYMVAAVRAHEQVHADHFDDGFKTTEVVDVLEGYVEELTADAENQAEAITKLRESLWNPHLIALVKWREKTDDLILRDHDENGPCETAEHEVVDPVINQINALAIKNGW
jgi:hypothetical protein